MLTRILDEDGATAIIIAAAMVLFLGMAALAVDYGLGVNERRADQTAVDVGSTAGAGAALNGIYGTNGVRTEALRYVRANLPTTYSDAEWRSIWESCVDPAAERNAGGHQFVALTPPAGWVATDPTNWCLSFETSSGLFRVRVPQQVIDAAFGPIVGVDELSTRAIAVSRIGLKGKSGILPFGLPGGANGVVCLSSGPSGISFDPCDGASAGNFGTIKAVKTGRQQLTPDDPVATTEDCSPNPNTVLAQNIAHGIDHVVFPDPDNSFANEIRDQCTETGTGLAIAPPGIDTLNTDTGFPQAAEAGLVGPVSGGYTPRLRQGPSGDLTSVFGFQVNGRPLWDYLLGSVTQPASCNPSTFDNSLEPDPLNWDDYNSDGFNDPPESWEHMAKCLSDYSSSHGIIFSDTLASNEARFGYVPEFWPDPVTGDTDLGNGSKWLHIRRFRAVFLQTTTWKFANPDSSVFHNPGEGCSQFDGTDRVYIDCTYTAVGISGNQPPSLTQLTAHVIPDSALPAELRGFPSSGGSGVNPFNVELFD